MKGLIKFMLLKKEKNKCPKQNVICLKEKCQWFNKRTKTCSLLVLNDSIVDSNWRC
jgi:hypothetical protein